MEDYGDALKALVLYESDIKVSTTLPIQFKILKAMCHIFLGNEKVASEAIGFMREKPDDEYLNIYFGFIRSMIFCLRKQYSLAENEITKLKELIRYQKKEEKDVNYRAVSNFFKRYYSALQQSQDKKKESLSKLKSDIEEFCNEVKPHEASFRPLTWLRKQLV